MATKDNLLETGRNHLSKGEFNKAIKTFDKAIKADPNDSEAYFGKAEASVGVPKVSIIDLFVTTTPSGGKSSNVTLDRFLTKDAIISIFNLLEAVHAPTNKSES